MQEKREGVVHKITCMTYPHRETLIASGRLKGHLVSEHSHSQLVRDKAPKLQTAVVWSFNFLWSANQKAMLYT